MDMVRVRELWSCITHTVFNTHTHHFLAGWRGADDSITQEIHTRGTHLITHPSDNNTSSLMCLPTALPLTQTQHKSHTSVCNNKSSCAHTGSPTGFSNVCSVHHGATEPDTFGSPLKCFKRSTPGSLGCIHYHVLGWRESAERSWSASPKSRHRTVLRLSEEV